MMKHFKSWSVPLLLIVVAFAGSAFAQTATIGGNIYTGQQVGGLPDYTTAPALSGAKVMVQDMDSGGFVTYGTVTGNTWTATVPVPPLPDSAEYVVMFCAAGHDNTSREFTVKAGDNLTNDAYLPPLPLPKANLLVYAFQDNYVNSEDDFPDDPGLKGVTFTVWDEEGNVIATGVSGLSPTLPTGAGPDVNGLYYFTNLEPGEYFVSADPTTVPTYDPGSGLGSNWYHMTTEEGTQRWEVHLYPGDPGTEAGAYLIWFGFVEKLGQLPPGPNTGSITGTLLDADGNDPAEPFPTTLPFVSPNGPVPAGFCVLFTNAETVPVHPVATTNADPVTGVYSFVNIPPGRYKIFVCDIPLDYVWTQLEITVAPNTAQTGVDILVPRFYARARGFVMDSTTVPPTPITGVKVHMRLKDGSVWKETTTDANGWYNFDELEEVEVIGVVDVEPPTGFRGKTMSRYVQWYTLNYRADMSVEPIPAGEGDIAGFVFNDHLATGTWVGDGVYNDEEERTFENVVINLYDAAHVLITSTSTNAFDEAGAIAQGWIKPYTYPPDEFGNVFFGPLPGHYQFKGLAPGTYYVEVVPPTGFSPAAPASGSMMVTVSGGAQTKANFGINTLVPLAGEIEGGVFDDINLDNIALSLLFEEKAGIPGTPVGIYDHLGYLMGVGYMHNPLCYTGSTVCPPGEALGQKPEVERRAAPGVHIYIGNDPAQPGFNPNYAPLALPYQFGQGKYKFEADWSLVPTAFAGLGGALLGNGNILPANAPVINNPPAAANVAANLNMGSTFRIQGQNFGDKQGYSTVSLSGIKLEVVAWTNTYIDVKIPTPAISGPILVATSTGISNALPVAINYTPAQANQLKSVAVYVDANNNGFAHNGSKYHPYKRINDAMANLPGGSGPKYVFIAPGTYNEQIHLRKDNIMLIGAGPRETVVNGLGPVNVGFQGFVGRGPVFYVGKGGKRGGLQNIMISGLSITGGSVADEIGAGIFIDYGNANIDINNCMIYRNGGYYGGGIWAHKSNHNMKIWANIIAENGNYGGYGGGISVNDEPEYDPPHSEPEHIVDDLNPGPPPGTYEIFNNVIFHNFSPDYGGGVSLYEIKDRLKIYGNVMMENRSDDHGGAMFFEDCGPVEIFGNVFLRNFCPDDGGAISFEDVGDTLSHIYVYNNLFAENIADDHGENHARGGALAFDDTFYGNVYNNTIVGNIVAGSYDPAGGGIDSERNGHEYNGTNGPYKAPGFSDPRIFNNIIWNNWRLKYDQAVAGEEDLDYTWGKNYRWFPDQLHVDNPHLQPDWLSDNNSESFSVVHYNDIQGDYHNGTHNLDIDPRFVDPAGLSWRLQAGSPAIGRAIAQYGPSVDLELFPRTVHHGMIDLGGFEWRSTPEVVVRIPSGILGAITMPIPGSSSLQSASSLAQRHR